MRGTIATLILALLLAWTWWPTQADRARNAAVKAERVLEGRLMAREIRCEEDPSSCSPADKDLRPGDQ